MRGRRIAAVIAIFVVALVVLAMASGFLVDWAWLASIDFSQVFWTIVWAKVLLFLGVLVVASVLLAANGIIALRLCGPRQRRLPPALWGQPPQNFSDLFDAVTPRVWRGLVVLALLAAGNLFCMACPFTAPRALARRWLPKAWGWPRPLRKRSSPNRRARCISPSRQWSRRFVPRSSTSTPPASRRGRRIPSSTIRSSVASSATRGSLAVPRSLWDPA